MKVDLEKFAQIVDQRPRDLWSSVDNILTGEGERTAFDVKVFLDTMCRLDSLIEEAKEVWKDLSECIDKGETCTRKSSSSDNVKIGETLMHFDAAVALMDDDIREELHDKMCSCSDQAFLDAYCKTHRYAYGEEFTV